MSSRTSWLATARDVVRTQLWPIPVAAVVTAILLGVGLPALDAATNQNLPPGVRSWVFGGDAAAARSLLDAIASSMITVTSLTFSLTVVTLQLASSQFSPRLLRTFTSDRFVQSTLALFLATFTFALTVLRTVRTADEGGQSEFVPRFAVTLAFLLAVASVVALVLFLAHLTSQIRIETMLRNVHRDATRTMNTVLEERSTGHAEPAEGVSPPPGALPLLAAESGFVTWIAQDRLLTVASDEDAVVRLDVHPGASIVQGTPLGSAWPASGAAVEEEWADRVTTRVLGCLHTGFERTAAQDIGFGLRQLIDVANKALSPGVNDPTTAIHALGHVSAFLCDLSERELGPGLLRDEDDSVRVVLHRPGLAAYVDLGLSQPRRYGASDPQVLAALFQVLLDLTHRVGPEDHPMIRGQLARLRTTVASQAFDSEERAALAGLGRRIEQNLG